MIKIVQQLPAWVFLIICTTCEVNGDALLRKAMYQHTGSARGALLCAGAALLFAYGFTLNLAQIDFGRVVGLYIATLFIVWQVTTYFTFHTVPSPPILVGGALIIAGGLLMTYWSPAPPAPPLPTQ